MAVLGVGVDLLRIDRIRSILDGSAGAGFVASTFTDEEAAAARRDGDPAVGFATRFAIKEAVFKSLGTSFEDGGLLRDIAVHQLRTGAPCVTLSGRFGELLDERGATAPLVSVSYEEDHVVAVAVLHAGRPRRHRLDKAVRRATTRWRLRRPTTSPPRRR